MSFSYVCPNDPRAKVLHPAPTILSFPGLEDLEPKGEVFLHRGHSHGSFRWKLRLPPGLFGCLMPGNPQGREFPCWLAQWTLNTEEKLDC